MPIKHYFAMVLILSLSLINTWFILEEKIIDDPIIVMKQVKKIRYSELTAEDKKQVDCLAKNIYHEAGFEPHQGWIAVGKVTINRMQSNIFPKSVCDVVYQKTGKTYQFSWVKIKHRLTKINHDVYNEVLEFATMFYFNHDLMHDLTFGATFYHADYVNPKWKNVEKTTKIGRHIFYRLVE